METDIIEVKNGAAIGIQVNLPKAKLLVIRAEKGYLVCGYFNPETIEKLKQTAIIISNVKNFKEMLEANPTYISKFAKKLGITKKMTGKEALEKMV